MTKPKTWEQQFKDEFGIHFKDSSGELKFALEFIRELVVKKNVEVLELAQTLVEQQMSNEDIKKPINHSTVIDWVINSVKAK